MIDKRKKDRGFLNYEHPKDVGMSYFAHLKFAWNESKEAWWMGIVMFVHGLIPWVWDWEFNQYLNEAKKRVEPQDEVRQNSWGDSTVDME